MVDTARSRDVGDVTLSFGTVRGHQPGRVVPAATACSPARCSARSRSTCRRGTLRTRAVWWTVDEAGLERAGLDRRDVPGAAHAAEHAVDRSAAAVRHLRPVGHRRSLDRAATPTPGRMTVFVYDGHPGGAGFAERGHAAALDWLTATRDAIAACECLDGCPSCVQSPKCGNGNEPLDKAGALRLLHVVLGERAPSA